MATFTKIGGVALGSASSWSPTGVPGTGDLAVWTTGSAVAGLTGNLNVSGVSVTANIGAITSASGTWTIGSSGFDFRGLGSGSATSRLFLDAGANYTSSANHTVWLNSTDAANAQVAIYQLNGTGRITLKNPNTRTAQTFYVFGTASPGNFNGIVDIADSDVYLQALTGTLNSATVVGSVAGWNYILGNGSSVSAPVQVGANGQLGFTARTATFSGLVSFTASATLTTAGTSTLSGGVSIPTGVTATFSPVSGAAISTNGFSGVGSFIKAGAATLTVSAASSVSTPFTGTVRTTTAGLSITNVNAFGDATFDTSSPAALTFTSAAFGALSSGTNYSFGTGTLTLGGVNVDISSSWAGGFTSNVSLVKSGPVGATGTLTLSGTSTRTSGTTSVARGVVRLASSQALYNTTGTTGATTVQTGNVAALELIGGISTPPGASLTLNGTGILGGGALRSISGVNSYGGLITLGSVASIAADAGSLTVPAITIAGNGLTLKPASGATITLAGSANTSTVNGTVTIDGAGTVIGAITNFLNLSAATNGTTVSGALNAAGFNASLGRLAGAGSITTSTGTSTLTIGGNSNTTFSGSISGAIALTKTGTGTQTLSGTNTFSGATSVNAGTLSVTGSIGAGSAVAVTITLNGTGSVGGAVTVATGGTVGAGLGAGSGNLSLGSTLAYSGTGFITPSAQALGANLSKVAITGALSLGGNVTVNATAPSWSAGTYEFASYASESGAGSFVAGTLTGASGRQSMGNVVTGAAAATFDVVTGNIAVTWAGGVSGDWYSGGTGWTGAGGINDFLNNDPATFSVSGAATPTVTLTDSVSVASLTMSGAAYTIGASGAYTLTNAGALAISGAFKQTLNVAGEHGSVGIAAGSTLELGNVNALGTNTNPITLTGSAAKLAFGSGANGLSTARPITLSPGGSVTSSLETSGGALATISGAVTGGQSTAALTKIGSGTVSLSGTNSYTSVLRVGGNTSETAASNVLRVTPSALANTNLRLNAGSVIEINGGSSPYTFSRTYGTGATAFYTENLVAGAGGGFSSFGTGGLTVSANITFGTTATSQWVGPMYLGTALGTARSATTLSGSITLNADTRFYVFDGIDGIGSSSSSATISSVIGGTSGLYKYGPGKLSLPSANTFQSITAVIDGTVEASVLASPGQPSSIGLGGTVYFGFTDPATPAATFRYVGPTVSSSMTFIVEDYCTLDASGSGVVTFTSNIQIYPTSLTVTGSNTGDNRIGNALFSLGGASSSLAKTGSGTWLIDCTSSATWTTRTGPATISAGVLKAKTSTASGLATLGSGAVALSATLQAWNTTSGGSSIEVSSLTTSGGSARIILGA